MREGLDLEDIDYKFDKDNDGMYNEMMNKQSNFEKYYLGIKGIPKKPCNCVHYKEVKLNDNYVLKFYHRFDDRPHFENKHVIKNKNKKINKEDKYIIISEDKAEEYIEFYSQGIKECINYRGKDENGKKTYIRRIMNERVY
jgi:hypothetical protein